MESKPTRPRRSRSRAAAAPEGGAAQQPPTVVLPTADVLRLAAYPGGPPSSSSKPALRQLQVGDVLNNIYRVTRQIGRGGMSEIFEGVNVKHEDDHVAIKVMLPSLADDERMLEMLRRETMALVNLTRISEPALVQYRLIAEEPTLGVHYLVMELIEGPSLANVLGKLSPDPKDLCGVLRRLARGLRAAHDLGVVHRDLSPENIMLPGGRLDLAKIIDFGIVKNLNPGSWSIIGDGFAGKLGYAAPEQLGDFERDIGPWTDVYSLGLLIVSLALGRDVDMGASVYEAIERRRTGPDLAPIHPALQPLIRSMVAQNPADRLRDMRQVLAGLTIVEQSLEPPRSDAASALVAQAPVQAAGARWVSLANTALGFGALVLAAGLGVVLVTSRGPSVPRPAAAPVALTLRPVSPSADTVAAKTLAQIPCSWLSLVSAGGGGQRLGLEGVVASPAGAQDAVARAVASAGDGTVVVDTAATRPLPASLCGVVDTFRAIRSDGGPEDGRLLSAAATYQLEADGGARPVARPTIDVTLTDPTTDAAVFGIDASGVSAIAPSRASLKQYQVSASNGAASATESYTLRTDTDQPGLSGVLLLTGRGPFNDATWSPPSGAPASAAAWSDRVRQSAAAGGWKAQIVWFDVVAPGGR